MDKLTMAHDYALVRITCNNPKTLDEIISLSWYYADAMQAEADKREDRTRPEVLEEWQPDWSQAPEWAEWWATDSIGYSAWYSYKPYYGDGRDYWSDYNCKFDNSEKSGKAPSFDYQGNWKNSLRKRPQ